MGRQESLRVVIDPAVDRSVLLFNATKPWNFWWESEEAMAADLGNWYEVAAARLLAERDGGPPNDATGTGVWGLTFPDDAPEAPRGV